MSFSSTIMKTQYTGNGSTVDFSFPYLFLDATHLVVYELIISTAVERTVDASEYSIDPAEVGIPSGGDVTFITAPTSDHRITIRREVPLTQLSVYVENAKFSSTGLMEDLDLAIMAIQLLNDNASRALTLPVSDTGVSAELPLPEALKTFRWNALATALEATDDPAVSAAAAALAQAAAELAQTAAELAETNANLAQVAAELAETNAETAQTAAELAETNAETAETGAVAAQGLAEVARDAAQAAAAGIYWKEPVVIATTSNITLSGEQTIDGVLTSADRILVKDQTAQEENGIYVTDAAAWSRATPMDTWDEHIGATVNVSQGTVNEDTSWICTVDAGGTLGTTAITWGALGAVYGSATTSAEGIIQLATDAEVAIGTDASKAVTSAGAAAHYSPIDRELDSQTGSTYTLVLTDAGDVVTMDNGSGNTLTVPTNASIAFAVGVQVDVVQKGAGLTTITGATGVTVNDVPAGSADMSGQYTAVTLLKVATDTWLLVGAHGGVA